MKAEQIIYYNEYSGVIEPCNGSNIHQADTIDIGGHVFFVEHIAKNLYLEKEVRFPIFKQKISMTDFLNGKPKLDTNEKIYEAVFRLTQVSLTSMTIEMDEYFCDEPCDKVGKIQFYKKKGINIKEFHGDAIIRIFDVPYLGGAKESQRLLGQFATNVGLYFLVDLNGQWNQLDNSASFVDAVHNEMTREIKNFASNETQKLLKANDELHKSINLVHETQKSNTKDILDKLDRIDNKIDTIQTSIMLYKEDVDDRLNELYDENDKEQAISMFADQVVHKITRTFSEYNGNDEYEQTKLDLELKFGNQWNKLNEISKDFLITGKLLFNNLNKIEKPLDYSGVCILVTKAVELELKYRFYEKFCDYLEDYYPRQYDLWHYAVCRIMSKNGKKIIQPIDEHSFTLGSIPHVCCIYHMNNIPIIFFENSKKRIFEYAKRQLFNEYNDEEIKRNIEWIGKTVSKIKNHYRNPAAHTNPLQKTDAQQCFDEIVDIQKELKKILELCKI